MEVMGWGLTTCNEGVEKRLDIECHSTLHVSIKHQA
jgi:hypothetical protein